MRKTGISLDKYVNEHKNLSAQEHLSRFNHYCQDPKKKHAKAFYHFLRFYTLHYKTGQSIDLEQYEELEEIQLRFGRSMGLLEEASTLFSHALKQEHSNREIGKALFVFYKDFIRASLFQKKRFPSSLVVLVYEYHCILPQDEYLRFDMAYLVLIGDRGGLTLVSSPRDLTNKHSFKIMRLNTTNFNVHKEISRFKTKYPTDAGMYYMLALESERRMAAHKARQYFETAYELRCNIPSVFVPIDPKVLKEKIMYERRRQREIEEMKKQETAKHRLIGKYWPELDEAMKNILSHYLDFERTRPLPAYITDSNKSYTITRANTTRDIISILQTKTGLSRSVVEDRLVKLTRDEKYLILDMTTMHYVINPGLLRYIRHLEEASDSENTTESVEENGCGKKEKRIADEKHLLKLDSIEYYVVCFHEGNYWTALHPNIQNCIVEAEDLEEALVLLCQMKDERIKAMLSQNLEAVDKSTIKQYFSFRRRLDKLLRKLVAKGDDEAMELLVALKNGVY